MCYNVFDIRYKKSDLQLITDQGPDYLACVRNLNWISRRGRHIF